jgi:pyruvate kinase
VWKGAVKLVSEFEADLRKEMKGGGGGGDAETSNGKGKGRMGEPASPPPPLEQAMYAQLDKMRAVMAGLEERLHVVEENGWNLLICAIGAELEAFRQAENMLREALRAAGFDVGDDDGGQDHSTPHLGRSTSLRDSSQRLDEAEPTGGGKLVDLHEEPEDDREPESDNEVPPDLLVAAAEEHEPGSPDLSREDSNEIPAEFLREHALDGEGPGLGVMA